MKKSLAIVATLLGVVLLGAPTASTALAADNNTAAKTGASISFTPGGLNLTNVVANVVFSKGVGDIASIWTSGLNATADENLGATVEDFRGNDDSWTLSVKRSAWKAGAAGDDAGAAVLEANATLKIDATPITQENSSYYTQDIKEKKPVTEIAAKSLGLTTPEKTAVKQGTYSTTLNWTLAAGVLSNAD